MTKPKGDHATFVTDCIYCRSELTVTNGRADFHQCVRVATTNIVTLDDLQFPEPTE